MALDWNFFSRNLPASFTEDKASSVVASGGGSRSLKWTIGAGNNSWIGYMYNPRESEFPNKYVRISAAMRGANWNLSSGIGMCLGFCPNPLEGVITDTSLLSALIVPLDLGTLRLYPRLPLNGAVTSSYVDDYTYRTVTTVNNSFVQFEAMLLLNSIFKDHDVYGSSPKVLGGEARIYTRWNTGSSLTVPGSVDWTEWYRSVNVNWAYHGHQITQYNFLNGVYPFFGALASNWTGSTAEAYFDYITIQYGPHDNT